MTDATEHSCIEAIGQAAGRVWHKLNDEGPTSITKLSKAFDDLPRDTVMQAIGWLAREDRGDETRPHRVAALELANDVVARLAEGVAYRPKVVAGRSTLDESLAIIPESPPRVARARFATRGRPGFRAIHRPQRPWPPPDLRLGPSPCMCR